jgi:hypothetical protein
VLHKVNCTGIVCEGVDADVESGSYDLDLDKRLSEETTVLVENYTVGPHASLACSFH